ncbi:aquaporin family protein [Candidatus Pelagibacter bacterium]|nr:aquaporin family protein [Candidatus Pelagibacter bacterium]
MKNRIFIGEFVGSAFLVMIIVGSGIMAQNLTRDFAVMLLANTLATGAGLFVLINSIADISGAHFNPAVTMVMYFTKKIKKDLIVTYLSAQILGCLLGVMLANFMFELPLIELSKKVRPGFNIFIAELIATFGLIFIIFGTLKKGSASVAASVATYITAGYWFTSSTSFANPAVTLARTFTDTFTGISYLNTPSYIVAEIIGALLALFIIKKIISTK